MTLDAPMVAAAQPLGPRVPSRLSSRGQARAHLAAAAPREDVEITWNGPVPRMRRKLCMPASAGAMPDFECAERAVERFEFGLEEATDRFDGLFERAEGSLAPPLTDERVEEATVTAPAGAAAGGGFLRKGCGRGSVGAGVGPAGR